MGGLDFNVASAVLLSLPSLNQDGGDFDPGAGHRGRDVRLRLSPGGC